MIRIPRYLPALATAALPAASIVSAQATDLKCICEKKDGLVTPKPDPELGIDLVTTETVPGKDCKPVGAQLPGLALPAAPVMKNIAGAAVRATRSVRAARVQAGVRRRRPSSLRPG